MRDTAVKHFLLMWTMSLYLPVVPVLCAQETGEILGEVYRQGSRDRISSAQVRLRETDQETLTNSAGKFRFENLPPGEYTLSISAQGYRSADHTTVTVKPGKATEVKLYLEPIPFLLPEVPVTAERFPATVSQESLQSIEIKRMPGTAGDALRALPSLPGISVANDFDGSLYIRGGAPEDNVFYFDRLPIGYPYHFFGLVSTVSSEVIERMDVYAGGFGAEFGADAQAVIDIHSRRGNQERFAGKFNINMLYSEGMVEGPIGKRGTWYVAGRRSYLDLLVPLFIDLDEEVEVGPNMALPRFWDYQARFSYDLSEKHQLTLNAFATSDFFNIEAAFEEEAEIEYFSYKNGFNAQGIHLRSHLTDRLTSNLTLSRSYNLFRIAHGASSEAYFFFEIAQPTYQLREDLTYKLNSRYQLESGVLFSNAVGSVSSFLSDPDRFDEDFSFFAGVELDADELKKLDVARRFTHLESYLQARYTPVPFLSAALGVRSTYLNFTDELSVKPRASLQFQVSDGSEIRLLYGQYNQRPQLRHILPDIGNPNVKSSVAKHYVLEVERAISSSTYLKLAGYYKDHDKIIMTDDVSKYLNQGEGFARGAEVLLRHRQGGRFFGFLSYAYSRSRRREQPEAPLHLYSFDQTHVATLVGSYNLTPTWEIGAKWRYSTGNPYTPTIGFEHREERKTDARFGEVIAISEVPVLGEVNSLRVPPFHRLDIRIKKSFIFDRWQMGVFLELFNVYNRKNVLEFYFESNDLNQKEAFHQLPFIPYLGVMMAF